jgi:methylmalonyl-CoA/ethylmalonyl-CoA epimerase
LEAVIVQLEAEGMRLISEPKPGLAFAERRICWLIGDDMIPIELVERRSHEDVCEPGTA